MIDRWTRPGVAGVPAEALTSVAAADEPTERDLPEKGGVAREQVAALRADQETSRLNKRRAEQAETLVGEVLEDADTRASLQGEGMTGR